jgi:FlaA1/EpsC-like NDP-sugar epimerase
VAFDAVLVGTAWVGALVLRYDGVVPEHAWDRFWSFLPIALGISLITHCFTGMYGAVWRHASIREARQVVTAQLLSAAALVSVVVITGRPVPLSVPVVGAVLATALTGGVRFHSRLFAFRRQQVTGSTPLVIIGAGQTGAALARDINGRGEALRAVAFVDDDPHLLHRRVQGLPVSGAISDLPHVATGHDARQAILAVPSADNALVQRAVAAADAAGITLRVLPSVTELVDGPVTIRDVRDLEIGDLLGRDPVETDLDVIAALVSGRRVLVTGGGGSIGSEIARQVARLDPERVILLDNDETHLFDAAATLAGTGVQRLADVRDAVALERVLQSERPHLIFHAAAHKHVPLLEAHPIEAARTNVFGTRNLLDAAERAGVERFIFISTDKAVEPRSVMGATKRIGEFLTLTGDPNSGMTRSAVRFGNVLGSRGSVIPTFMQQIRSKGPVTVTDGRMTRYFMSIPEAVRLVLHAAALSAGGEIFMLDMGKPVPIVDLAHRMIRLTGRRPGYDIEIRITGTRPGEKLVEELHTGKEETEGTTHPSIVRLRPQLPTARALDIGFDRLRRLLDLGDDDVVRRQIFDLARADRVITLDLPEQARRLRSTAEGTVWNSSTT